MRSVAFVTSCDAGYVLGARGLVRSIRRFYGLSVDIIVVFSGVLDVGFRDFCVSEGVIFLVGEDVGRWVLPLVYGGVGFGDNVLHSHHPGFVIRDGWPWLGDQGGLRRGFGELFDFHPFVTKAYGVGFALFCGYDRVVQIDCDAFLLSDIDVLFGEHSGASKVVTFCDGPEALYGMELLGFRRLNPLVEAGFSFNSGVVLFNNGVGVRRLVLDYMFFIGSPYHFRFCGYVDQGLIRCLVAGFHVRGDVDFVMLPCENWNPVWGKADRLFLRGGEWFNRCNGLKQFIWHGAGGHEKIWRKPYFSGCVNEAWAWVGGEVGF